MAGIASIGEPSRVSGFALAGVEVYPAEGSEAVTRAWRSLPQHIAVVVLTPSAARALDPDVLDDEAPLLVVMPS